MRSKPVRPTSKTIKDAIDRGLQHKAALLIEAGGSYSTDEVASLLGTTTEELQDTNSFLAVTLDNGDRRWPAFQFENRATTAGVEKVLEAVHVIDPWAKLHFFFLHLQELGGRTPVQAIREGSLEAVVLAAKHFGDHGAS